MTKDSPRWSNSLHETLHSPLARTSRRIQRKRTVSRGSRKDGDGVAPSLHEKYRDPRMSKKHQVRLALVFAGTYPRTNLQSRADCAGSLQLGVGVEDCTDVGGQPKILATSVPRDFQGGSQSPADKLEGTVQIQPRNPSGSAPQQKSTEDPG